MQELTCQMPNAFINPKMNDKVSHLTKKLRHHLWRSLQDIVRLNTLICRKKMLNNNLSLSTPHEKVTLEESSHD